MPTLNVDTAEENKFDLFEIYKLLIKKGIYLFKLYTKLYFILCVQKGGEIGSTVWLSRSKSTDLDLH
jgi:hypothetical protein